MPKISAYIPDGLAERLEKARGAGQDINQSSVLQDALERKLDELNSPADPRLAGVAARYREIREVEVARYRAAYDFSLDLVVSWKQPPSLHTINYYRELCHDCAKGEEGEFEQHIQEFDVNPLPPDPETRKLFEHALGKPLGGESDKATKEKSPYRLRRQAWLGMEQAFNDLLAAMREQDQAISREEVSASEDQTASDERP